MIRDQLQALLRQRPFQPFRIQLTDGRSFDIHYPRMHLLAQTYINIGIPVVEGPDPTLSDRVVHVPFRVIEHIEAFPQSQRPVAS